MEHSEDAFESYLKYEKRYSEHTVAAYKRDLKEFKTFVSDNGKEEKDVDFKLIRRWIVKLKNDENNSSRTVNRKIATLRSYFKYLNKTGLTNINPMDKVGLLKTDKNLPDFVEIDKMDRVLDEEMDDAHDFETMRDKMVVELFYMTGMRLSELVNLKDSSIDAEAMTVKLLGKRNKERIIPLTDDFLRRLQVYVSLKNSTFPDAASLFVLNSGKPIYARWVQRLTDKNLGLATSAKKRSPHVLRHSFATNMLSKGAELNAIKELLGHSSLAATQVYTHSSIKRLKKVYKQAHPRGAKK